MTPGVHTVVVDRGGRPPPVSMRSSSQRRTTSTIGRRTSLSILVGKFVAERDESRLDPMSTCSTPEESAAVLTADSFLRMHARTSQNLRRRVSGSLLALGVLLLYGGATLFALRLMRVLPASCGSEMWYAGLVAPGEFMILLAFQPSDLYAVRVLSWFSAAATGVAAVLSVSAGALALDGRCCDLAAEEDDVRRVWAAWLFCAAASFAGALACKAATLHMVDRRRGSTVSSVARNQSAAGPSMRSSLPWGLGSFRRSSSTGLSASFNRRCSPGPAQSLGAPVHSSRMPAASVLEQPLGGIGSLRYAMTQRLALQRLWKGARGGYALLGASTAACAVAHAALDANFRGAELAAPLVAAAATLLTTAALTRPRRQFVLGLLGRLQQADEELGVAACRK